MTKSLISFVAIFSLLSTVALAYKPNYYKCTSYAGPNRITYESDIPRFNYRSQVDSMNLEGNKLSIEKRERERKIIVSGNGSAIWTDQTVQRPNRDMRISITLEDVDISHWKSYEIFETTAFVSFPDTRSLRRIPMDCIASKVSYNYHPVTRR